jgi:hypothetical protein
MHFVQQVADFHKKPTHSSSMDTQENLFEIDKNQWIITIFHHK